jgi:hypothetical protein
VCQVADQQQVDAEQDQADVPDATERLDARQGLRIVDGVEEVGDRDEEHRRVREPEPRRERGQGVVHRREELQERSRDQHVEHDH